MAVRIFNQGTFKIGWSALIWQTRRMASSSSWDLDCRHGRTGILDYGRCSAVHRLPTRGAASINSMDPASWKGKGANSENCSSWTFLSRISMARTCLALLTCRFSSAAMNLVEFPIATVEAQSSYESPLNCPHVGGAIHCGTCGFVSRA